MRVRCLHLCVRVLCLAFGLSWWADGRTPHGTGTRRQERNREAEAATLAGIAASEATSDENPFKRVLELVGATDPGTGPDMSRFRGLMISLREEGLPAKPGMHRRLPTLGGGEDEELEGHGGRGDMGVAASSSSSSSSSSVRP